MSATAAPPSLERANAALEAAFDDAIRSRFHALRGLIDGKDAPAAKEIARIERGLKDDAMAYGAMAELVVKIFGKPAGDAR